MTDAVSYLDTGAHVHADDEEGVEEGEDVPVDRKDGGVETQEKLGENVAEDKRSNHEDASEHDGPLLFVAEI